MRLLAKVAYRGTNYKGWERQPNEITIQGTIEKILSQYLNEEVSIYASGRTDAGVHSYGQTFHFDTSKTNINLDNMLYSLNKMLPNDIYVYDIEEVEDDFSARLSAKEKMYSYLIATKEKDPFSYDIAYNCLYDIDIDKLNKALSYFKGQHNFKNFTSKEEDEQNFIREIYVITAAYMDDRGIRIDITGNGFMRYMIRFIVGTALEYAKGKIDDDFIINKLEADDQDRCIVSYKAPAQGLYLVKVFY